MLSTYWVWATNAYVPFIRNGTYWYDLNAYSIPVKNIPLLCYFTDWEINTNGIISNHVQIQILRWVTEFLGSSKNKDDWE